MTPSPHKIPLADAIVMTTRAREAKIIPIHAWRFDRDIFDAILAQHGAEGVRLYFALDDKMQPTLVVVGTDGEEKDMVGGDIGDLTMPCPPACDITSPLLTGR
jgi:hypothetical protein